MFTCRGRKIGSGGFGQVYMSGDDFAIKRFKPIGPKGIKTEVLREITILKKLNHPNIVSLIDVRYAEIIEIVMNYCGINLRNYAQQNPWTMRVSKLMHFSKQILFGLEYLHQVGVIHRDLKPDNILVLNEDVRICDFGISKKMRTATHTPGEVGTLAYRAPEIFMTDNYDEKVDIFALGCVLYEFIMKTQLFRGNSDIARIGKILEVVPTSKDDLIEIGLDLIDLSKCNTKSYFKLPAFYETKCDIKTRKFLDNFKTIITNMIHLNPKNRSSCTDALHEISKLDGISVVGEINSSLSKTSVDRSLIEPNILASRNIEVIWILEYTKSSKSTRALAIEILDYALVRIVNETVVDRNKMYDNLHIISCICLVLASKYIDVIVVGYDRFEWVTNVVEWELFVLKLIEFNLELEYDDTNDLRKKYLNR